MTDDEIMQLYADYDEDDDDCGLDEYLDSLEEEYESFDERLKRYDITLEELRSRFVQFKEWYEKTVRRIGAECGQKAIVCRALCRYIRSSGFDDDIIKFWCVCVSEHYDCIFPEGYDKDEQSVLYNFLALEDDIEDFMFRIKNEEAVKKEFRDLRDNISFADEPIAKIDGQKLYREFSQIFDIKGPKLEANLGTVTLDICRSPQLYRAAPLVYYGVIMRQTKKMTDTDVYEPNYHAVLETKVRCIDKDNGKNVFAIKSHIEMYLFFKQFLEGKFDEYFCDTGFSVMSNISQCALIPIEGITRPLYYQIRDESFTAFPNGFLDNPIAVRMEVESDDIMNYTYYDEKLPPKFRLLGRLRSFLAENEHFSDEYLDLVANGRTDQCMQIVREIFSGTGVESRFFKPYLMDIVYAVIIDELQANISGRIRSELLYLYEKKMPRTNGG